MKERSKIDPFVPLDLRAFTEKKDPFVWGVILGINFLTWKKGEAVHSLDEISQETGIGITKIKEVMTDLVAMEWFHKKRLASKPNCYEKMIPSMSFTAAFSFVSQSAATRESMSRPASDDQPPRGRSNSKSQKKTLSKQYTENFEMFWDLYPRKADKFGAFKEWLKLGQEGPTDDLFLQITEAVQIQVDQDWNDKEEKFIPHARTWLHNKRWEDKIRKGGPSGTVRKKGVEL